MFELGFIFLTFGALFVLGALLLPLLKLLLLPFKILFAVIGSIIAVCMLSVFLPLSLVFVVLLFAVPLVIGAGLFGWMLC